MLDKFLEVAYEHETHNNLRNEMAQHFKKLPLDELAKIASGELKLADGDADWLEKFRDTPMYDEALALEEEKLRLDISSQQQQGQNRQAYDAQDAVRLKQRMLELQLLQGQATPAPGMEAEGAGVEGMVPPPGLTQEPSPEPAGAPVAAGTGTPVGAEAKTAASKTAEKPCLLTAGKAAKAVAKKVGEIAKTSSVSDSVISSMRMSLATKTAEAKPAPELNPLAVADIWGRQMAKEAAPGILGAAWEGLKGAGKFLGQGASNLAKAPGLKAGFETAKDVGSSGLRRAAKWSAKNPLAAGAIGAGGLATAGAAGHMMGSSGNG